MVTGRPAGNRSATLDALAIGLLGTTVILVCFLAIDADVTVAALVLLVPIAVSSARGGYGVATIVAIYAAVGYALWFLPPIGHVRIGPTRDVATLLTFLAVGLLVGLLSGRRPAGADPAVLDERRASLLRTVSHDLRSPLHTIQTVTTELLSTGDLDEQTLVSLRDVADEATRLDRIVANLLSAGRIQAGALLPSRSPEYLPALVRTTAARFQRAHVHPVDLDVPDVPDVLVDPVQIDQVLYNLLDNATRHSPAGVPVTVRARLAGDRVEVTVTDRGPGFDTELLQQGPRLYGSGAASGIGLGLIVCDGIVAAHGGSLRLRNGRDGGARATFDLPLAAPAPPRPVQGQASSGTS
ncbi:sensor histidine kinase [Desertimonas flava]|jgi:two-component system sensor histidine kinase KdpD|uniref:sensor histidine kinase n=1 Tax=Desertimonas flava TaxID=2064846 RepID=UPI000E34301C|nr:DUF4118 domain-containing protein [Desertimonas flava]